MSASADLAIRMRRAAFNRALADANLDAIGPILAPNVVMITGTDSAVIAGRKAQLLAWKREFASPDRLVYTRTTESILVSPIEPIALEQGHWQGVAASGSGSVVSGAYSAKWRQTGAEWVIEGEIYLTLA